MKKSTLLIIAATLMLSACGLLNQSVTSESNSRFEDGIYSSAPTFRSKEQKQSSEKDVKDLVEKTRSSNIYRQVEQKEMIPAPSPEGYTYDPTNHLDLWSYNSPYTYYSPYVPYSIGSSWYWSRHYDPWYWNSWGYSPWYHGYGGWYNPWYYGHSGWHDPWYHYYAGWYGWYGYMSPYYCGWYGGWDPYWHHHHYHPSHHIAGGGKDVWYGSRKSVTGSRTGTGRKHLIRRPDKHQQGKHDKNIRDKNCSNRQ